MGGASWNNVLAQEALLKIGNSGHCLVANEVADEGYNQGKVVWISVLILRNPCDHVDKDF